MHVFRICAAALAAATLALAAEGSSFHWRGHLQSGQLIEIKGVNGGIRAEPAAGADVILDAEKSARRSDPADVRIEVVDNGNGMTICAVYPSRDGRNECKPGNGGRMNTNDNDVKVEFTVRVPAGVRFTGRTVNGGVDAERLGADVEAHTVNGKIVLSTAGAALAETVNGSISAVLGKGAWEGKRDFRTVNGSIDLALPADVSADLDASTVNGRIESDLPITVHGRFLRRSLHGTLGNGGGELKIGTVNGSITLRRGNSAV